jgi:hypothetical protein
LPRVLDAASRFERGPSAEVMADFSAKRNLQPLFV